MSRKKIRRIVTYALKKRSSVEDKKKGGLKAVLPLAISIVSILLSLVTFYITNLQVVHSLKVNYSLCRFKRSGKEVTITYRAVIQNNGNKTEGILLTDLYLKDGSVANYFHTLADSIFLVKSGEATIREYNFKFNIDSLHIFQTNSYDLNILYRLTGNRGITIVRDKSLMNLRISENNINPQAEEIIIPQELNKDKSIELIDN